jgi:hypothetical protein
MSDLPVSISMRKRRSPALCREICAFAAAEVVLLGDAVAAPFAWFFESLSPEFVPHPGATRALDGFPGGVHELLACRGECEAHDAPGAHLKDNEFREFSFEDSVLDLVAGVSSELMCKTPRCQGSRKFRECLPPLHTLRPRPGDFG